MHPILIDLGFIRIPTYGLLLALAVVVALWTVKLRADRSGLDGSRMVDLGVWVVIWALVGSKLLLVVVDWRTYLSRPGDILILLRSGGVFLGGFIAAVVAALVLIRRYRLPLWPTVDVFVPSLPLGHAIGRIGCLMAGCCWGARCDLPWAITYTSHQARELVGTPLGEPRHPFPVYAFLFNLTLFVALELLHRRRPTAGRVFATYLVAYGVGRFLLEFTRGDEARGFILGGMLSTSQLIAAIMVVLGVGVHAWIARGVRAR